jgi:peptidoglycan-associated lipoprotein
MRRRSAYLSLALLLGLLLALPGCRKSQPEENPSDAGQEPSSASSRPAPERDTRPAPEEVDSGDFAGQGTTTGSEPFGEQAISVDELSGRLGTVYFAYDSYDLSPTSLATLRENAEVLKAYASYGVAVEGHCDERGTIDYNLALGEQRASSVRDYLVSLGVERSRIRIITYGEERPVDPGHTEAAWSKNRRSEFVVER